MCHNLWSLCVLRLCTKWILKFSPLPSRKSFRYNCWCWKGTAAAENLENEGKKQSVYVCLSAGVLLLLFFLGGYSLYDRWAGRRKQVRKFTAAGWIPDQPSINS